MLEFIDACAKALAQWPVAEGFFMIVIAFLGLTTYRKGEKDRKSLGSNAIEIPLFLLNGPLADAMGAVHDMSEQSRITNDLLRQLNQEIRRQNDLMEWIGNQAGMLPRPH